MLALATDAYGGYGGIAQYNRDLIEALAARDEIRSIDVAVRTAPLDVPRLHEKVRQHPAKQSRLQYSLACAGLGLMRRPQIVLNGHLFHGPLAAQLANWTGAKLISQLHGTEVWGAIAQKHLLPLARSDLVLCVSRDTRQRLLALSPFLEERAFVLPNMVGPEFSPGDREKARRRFGLREEKVILTVARLDGRGGYKGHDRIIRMLPALSKEYNGSIRYLIAGQGEDRPRLEGLANELGVSELTVFLGRIAAEDLPDLYRASDLFAMPSTGEGFGIVYLEAMACGTPAIGLDIGGVADALADGDFGWCTSPEEFPGVLRKALSTPMPNRQNLSEKVHARFGQQAFRKRVGDALRTLNVN